MISQTLIISCFYFYLPVALANIGATLGNFIPPFKNIRTPVDFNLVHRNSRLVGDHKTIGNFLFGIILGTAAGAFKSFYLDERMGAPLLLNVSPMAGALMYTVLAVAALVGDLIKSFLKGLTGRPPHAAWIPFDEIDHSVASLLVLKLFMPISWMAILVIVVLFFFLHLLSNVIAYGLKIKSVPY